MTDLGHLGVWCPAPRVWVAGYGCLDPSNSITQAFTLNQVPALMGPDMDVDINDPAQPLSAEARAIIEGAGHTVDCALIGGANYCSIDGGEYSYFAPAVNRNPAVLLIESGAGPESYSYQQSIRTLLNQPASSPLAGNLSYDVDSGTTVQDGETPSALANLASSLGLEGEIAGFPLWAVLAAAAGGFYLMTKGGKG